jgi:7-keto-8-aminopelargonate synthetase-like enzyme
VAGALAALDLIEHDPTHVQRLRSRARTLRGALAAEGFDVSESEMHIVPLRVGDERDALALGQGALERGVFAQAIRAPSVPVGSARLRLTAMASHTPAELRRAARVLCEAARALGLNPAAIGAPAAQPWSGAVEEVSAQPEPRRRDAEPAGAITRAA